MARARSNGGAYAWALVVFGCGFVVSLLVAIIFYTKIEQHKNAEQSAKDTLATYVNESQDKEGLQPWLTGEGDSKSAFRRMQEEILRNRSEVEAWNTRVQTAQSKQAAAEALLADTQRTIADRDAQLKRQQDQAAAALEAAETRAHGLDTRLSAATEERDELAELVQNAMQDLDATTRTQLATLNSEIGDLEDMRGSLEDTIEALRADNQRLREIKNPLITRDVTTADGEVLSVFNSGGQLFVDRGRKQGVMLGMTFEVFDANEVIRLSEIGAPRGKATIEVYDLQEDTATCRIVRRNRGAQIVEGDVIANIIYDPNVIFTFYVFGEFDIEFDGGRNDIDRIENLVTEWGGRLIELEVDEDELPILSPEIDFLVLGAQPEYPEPTESLDPEVIRAWQAQVKAYESYQLLLDDAKLMRIPVLNQNRFIELSGYYER